MKVFKRDPRYIFVMEGYQIESYFKDMVFAYNITNMIMFI